MEKSFLEKLLKFSPEQYTESDFVFDSGSAFYQYAGLMLVLIIGVVIVYYLTNLYTSSRAKAISFTLKTIGLILLCLPLLEPALVIPDIIPNENFLAVLVDNSSSMNLPDGSLSDKLRADDVDFILNNETNGIHSELEENFKVRYYAFDSDVSRIDSLSYLTFNGTETNIAQAMQRVISDFRGLPLAGVVLFTDGSDNSSEDPQSMAEELGGYSIPLHIVGVGGETFGQDRELLEVSYSKGLREGSGAEVWARLRSWSDEQSFAALNIYNGEEVVHSETVRLQGNGNTDQVTFFFEPEADQAEEYVLKIEETPNEVNIDNNTQSILLDTRNDSVRVLYFEGHLRSDFKFIKRALENDQVFEFTSLTRTGGDKYFRQGIKHANELQGGFPVSQEELFQYKALIFGDIEASYFTIDQLEMVERFVRDRGGGFLMLGAKNSFSEGDYSNTPIANILPVVLDPSRKQIIMPDYSGTGETDEYAGFNFVPTRSGYDHPILKLVQDIGNNRALWNEMNKLTHINLYGGVKPGAVTLAEKKKDGESTEPLLVIQRYGKGQTAALATASTWRWQLQRDADDLSHERFWRQLVRWLVSTDSESC